MKKLPFKPGDQVAFKDNNQFGYTVMVVQGPFVLMARGTDTSSEVMTRVTLTKNLEYYEGARPQAGVIYEHKIGRRQAVGTKGGGLVWTDSICNSSFNDFKEVQ